MEDELDQISIKNNFDIIIRNNQGSAVYLSNKDFLANVKIIIDFWGVNGKQEYQISIEQQS